MTVKTEHLLDKSTWLPGPWVDEYDRYEWVDEGSRLPCLVLRNPNAGNLCGYVGVPPGHLAWGMHYNDLHQVKVHGGLTFNGPGEDVDAPDDYTDYWYYGYDCAHFGDKFGFATPLSMLPFIRNGEYRDAEYCMNQCERLASQLIKIDC
jgi:hypothetical protein